MIFVSFKTLKNFSEESTSKRRERSTKIDWKNPVFMGGLDNKSDANFKLKSLLDLRHAVKYGSWLNWLQ